jgi:hypothetical protein
MFPGDGEVAVIVRGMLAAQQTMGEDFDAGHSQGDTRSEEDSSSAGDGRIGSQPVMRHISLDAEEGFPYFDVANGFPSTQAAHIRVKSIVAGSAVSEKEIALGDLRLSCGWKRKQDRGENEKDASVRETRGDRHRYTPLWRLLTAS